MLLGYFTYCSLLSTSCLKTQSPTNGNFKLKCGTTGAGSGTVSDRSSGVLSRLMPKLNSFSLFFFALYFSSCAPEFSLVVCLMLFVPYPYSSYFVFCTWYFLISAILLCTSCTPAFVILYVILFVPL